jgi:iron complex transport system substrate-binding protein
MTRIRSVGAVLLALALLATPVAGALGTSSGSPTAGTMTQSSASAVESATSAEASASVPGCEYPVELRDATGATVELDAAASSVVTTGPAAAQTMWEFGAQDSVVGVTQFAHYLDGASAKTNVSGEGRQRLSIERVVALDPDVVLAENVTSPDAIQSLRNAGLTVYHFNNSESLADVYEKIAVTGTLTGECDAAVETVREMKTEVAIVEEARGDEPERDFLYSLYGYTAGPNTFISHALTIAGGNNLAAGVVEFPPTGYAPINPETVANLSVDWIVYPGTQAAIPRNPAWNQTTAVQEGNLLGVKEDYISQPAPRVAIAIRDVAKAWYPDAYASANESMRGNVEVAVDLYASATAGTTTTAAGTSGNDDGTTAPSTDGPDGESTSDGNEGTATDTGADSIPGFGALAVLAAIASVVGVALARRR